MYDGVEAIGGFRKASGMSATIKAAMDDLAEAEQMVVEMTVVWWNRRLRGDDPTWPPAGFLTVMRGRNEARERVVEAGGGDPDVTRRGGA